MKGIDASGFVKAGNNLMLFGAPARVFAGFPDRIDIDSIVEKESLATPLESLRTIQRDCMGLDLNVTLLKVNRIIAAMEASGMTWRELAADTRDIFERLTDELNARLFLAIDSGHAPYYNDFASDWATVIEAFPSVAFDIKEAAKSFALNRYTACVCHLMRILEAGLASVVKRIGLKNPRPGWEEAITYMEGQLGKKYKEMDNLFRGDVDFLPRVAAHMRDVNIAWRRRVAHIESKYTEEEAHRIYASTKSLMEHIGAKLSEVGDS